MIFQDRTSAGKQLAGVIAKDQEIVASKKDLVVLSLVRGGAAVGYEIAKRLNCPHFPLVVKKIGAPGQEELAIGAVCNGEYFLDEVLINRIGISRKEVEDQIRKAKDKQREYLRKFATKKINFQGKVLIIVDDGIATGASVQAAVKYLKKERPRKIILAAPVAPSDFDETSADWRINKVFILHKDQAFHAVGQFYQDFEQVEDDDIMGFYE